MDLSVIIVNYNTEGLLRECIGRLRAACQGLAVNIVIVDNASRDNSVALIRSEFTDCELIVNTVNVGFGRANNQGLPLARGRYLLLINTDAFVAPDSIRRTMAYMDEHPRCGILGVKLVGRDGRLQPSARYFPTPWNQFLVRTGLAGVFRGTRLVDDMDWGHDEVRDCDWVPGCYYLVRREVTEEVGLFDPRFFLYYEEVDHCFAAKKAGWEVTFYPFTTVVHIGGESAKSEGEITQSGRQLDALQMESALLYFRKNHAPGGAWLHLLLSTVADAILVARRLLTVRRPFGFAPRWRHAALMWSLFARTGHGTRPTR
jgi:GT2 family glycosyltransferase